MPKSMKLLLRISSILVLVLSSCSTNNVVKDYTKVPLENASFEVPYFSNPTMDYVYKANIRVYGNELTGIFIAKKINDSTHRMVFTTEFGNKLLDFEISERDFIVNSIVSELDRKILINTLVNDFRLLLRSHYVFKEQFDSKESNVYLSEDRKLFNYLFISKLDNTLSKIVQTTKRKEKINLFFTVESNIFASKIIIEHKTIPLNIELNYFKEQIN
jgi:phosphoribosylformylglycinamidine (FGAM) synthase PurS component